MPENPKTGTLHFPGDVRSADFGPLGPSQDWRMFQAQAAEYDETTDMTTVHVEEI